MNTHVDTHIIKDVFVLKNKKHEGLEKAKKKSVRNFLLWFGFGDISKSSSPE
jgi:hypothetical protein